MTVKSHPLLLLGWQQGITTCTRDPSLNLEILLNSIDGLSKIKIQTLAQYTHSCTICILPLWNKYIMQECSTVWNLYLVNSAKWTNSATLKEENCEGKNSCDIVWSQLNAEFNSTHINGVGFTLAEITWVGLVIAQINPVLIVMFPDFSPAQFFFF